MTISRRIPTSVGTLALADEGAVPVDEDGEDFFPADGVVAERYFNNHELIRDEVLLSIVDYSKVYVELSAFPNDINQLQPGMPLTVFSLHHVC